jgi:hypothetical protein
MRRAGAVALAVLAAWPLAAQEPSIDTYITRLLTGAESRAVVPAVGWPVKKARIQAGLRHSAGLDLNWRWPELNPRVESTVPRQGYRIEQVSAEFWPGVRYAMHVYVPDGRGPFPAVVMVATDLRSTDTHGGGARDPLFQQLAGGMARLGILVTGVIPLGKATYQETYPLNGIAMLVGTSTPQEHLNTARRALDYMVARTDVDRARVGVTGLSLGGWVTLFLAATDPRIGACAPGASNWTFSGILLPSAWRTLYDTPEGALPEVLTYGGNYATVAASMAPKWVHYLNCEKESERLQYIPIIDGAAKASYAAAGVAERYSSYLAPCPHWYCEPMQVESIGWFHERFFGKRPAEGTLALRKIPEERVRRRRTINTNLRIEELLVRDASGDYTPIEVIEPYDADWKRLQVGELEDEPGKNAFLAIIAARREESRAARLASVKRPSALWLADLRHSLGIEGLKLNPSVIDHDSLLTLEPEPGLKVQARRSGDTALDRSRPVTLVVGSQADREVFGTGAAQRIDLDLREERAMTNATMLLMILNRPPLGMWVWDAVTAVHALRSQGYPEINLVGAGDTGAVVAALAGVLTREASTVQTTGSRIQSLDADVVGNQLPKTRFWAHRLLRVADLPDCLALLRAQGRWRQASE